MAAEGRQRSDIWGIRGHSKWGSREGSTGDNIGTGRCGDVTGKTRWGSRGDSRWFAEEVADVAVERILEGVVDR